MTAVGEVPPATVRSIASSVTRAEPARWRSPGARTLRCRIDRPHRCITLDERSAALPWSSGDDCELCDQMLAELAGAARRTALPPIDVLDVDSDAELRAAMGCTCRCCCSMARSCAVTASTCRSCAGCCADEPAARLDVRAASL